MKRFPTPFPVVAGTSNANPFQYTGRENDATGLYYYRARYYHSGLQRFISEDPSSFSGGDFNLYVYAANNPTDLEDPLGLQPVLVEPGPLGRAYERTADMIDEGNRQQEIADEFTWQTKLFDEIERKIRAKRRLNCDSYYVVCYLIPTPTRSPVGSVKVYGPFARPIYMKIGGGYICGVKMVPGVGNCCSAQ